MQTHPSPATPPHRPTAPPPPCAPSAHQLAQYAELVVSVARKTDAQLWPSLFAAVGSPAELGEGLRAAGDLQSAACCLLIVDHIEGTAQVGPGPLSAFTFRLPAGGSTAFIRSQTLQSSSTCWLPAWSKLLLALQRRPGRSLSCG